jgi:hypothetical protein
MKGDNLHMEFPFCRQPNVAGPAGPGRVPVGAAARRRADEALHRRANIISPAPGHKIPPNCCEKLPTSRPNQVWAMDIATITPLGQRCASPDHCLAASLLSVSGGPSNMRRFTRGPTPAFQRPAAPSVAIWIFATADGPIQRRAGKPQTKPTSTQRCPIQRQRK